jgi:hypothetical protein
MAKLQQQLRYKSFGIDKQHGRPFYIVSGGHSFSFCIRLLTSVICDGNFDFMLCKYGVYLRLYYLYEICFSSASQRQSTGRYPAGLLDKCT